jgi:hypothetical protein
MRRHWLLLAAIGLIGAFVGASQLPVADMLFAFPMSFVIPSALNLIIAWYIVSHIVMRSRIVKLGAFVIVSALLAVSIELPAIWKSISAPPQTVQVIERTVQISSDQRIFAVVGFCPLPRNCGPGILSYVMVHPLESRIKMGFDMKNSARVVWIVKDQFWDTLRTEFVAFAGMEPHAWQIVANPRKDSLVYLTITVTPNSADAGLATIAVEVSDFQGKASAFTITDAPYGPTMESRAAKGLKSPILNASFEKNMAHILSHDTFWSPLIGRWVDIFPRGDFRRFLRSAVQVPAGPSAPK